MGMMTAPGLIPDADTVIIFGGNDAGNERPVAANVREIMIIIDKIPTVDIVDKTVVVVINAVAGDLFEIFPDILAGASRWVASRPESTTATTIFFWSASTTFHAELGSSHGVNRPSGFPTGL